MRCRLHTLLALGCVGLRAGSAFAAWPSDAAVNVPISTAAGRQSQSVITSDGSGGAIIAWLDDRIGTYYAQRVSAAGNTLWATDGVGLCNAGSNKVGARIVADALGGAIITWADQRGGLNYDIYAQRVDSTGALLWVPQGAAVCALGGTQANPALVADGSGGAIFTWYDLRSGPNTHLYAQRMSAYSAPQWTANGVAVCTAAGNQAAPRMSSDGEGGTIITWIDSRNGNDDIYAQRLDSSGIAQWQIDGVPLCTAVDDQQYPVIVADGSGGALVAWEDQRKGTELDIYAQRVSAAGVPQWTTDGVPVCAATGDQAIPQIDSDGAGGAVVTWSDYRPGASFGVYAQRIDASGAPQWAVNGVSVSSVVSHKWDPCIASDGSGGAIMSWSDDQTGRADIYAQRLDASGSPRWGASGLAVCTAPQIQFYPSIVSDGAGGIIDAWTDARSDTVDTDVYAQRVLSNGQPGGAVASVPRGTSSRLVFDPVRPNPAVATSTLEFTIPHDLAVTLTVLDASGRRVRALASGMFAAGAHSLVWDLRDQAGNPVTAGLYFVRLAAGSEVRTQRVVALR